MSWLRTKMNTNTYQMQVGEIIIDIVKKDIKNLHLGVYPPDGRVRIAAPLRLKDDAIRVFAVSKLAWIKKKQEKYSAQERQSRREYISRESHYYEGRRFLLKVIYNNAPPYVEIRNKTHIDLYVRPGASHKQRKKAMTEWYRTQLKKKIPEIIEKWQKVIRVEIDDWGVKQMRTRWGTCNQKAKRIWINLELAKKPTHCLDFIIVHEMVHLLESNHNDQFRAYMDEFIPQWRKYKEELNQSVLSHDGWSY